jgi:KaiC/GvpD/RAD55 family RecA-like ATPase
MNFGIQEIDNAIGGLDLRKNYLLIGSKATAKERAIYSLIKTTLSQPNTAILYVLSRTGYNDFLNELSSNGVILGAKLGSQFKIIDTFTRTITPSAPEPPFAKLVNSPLDLTGISVNISIAGSEFLRDMKTLITIFDSVSVFLLYNPPATTFRFIQYMCGRTKITGGIGIYLLDEDMHTPQINETIRSLVDGVIEFKEENGKRYFRAHGTQKEAMMWQEVNL